MLFVGYNSGVSLISDYSGSEDTLCVGKMQSFFKSDDKNYLVEVLVPGFSKDDLYISVSKNSLTVGALVATSKNDGTSVVFRKEFKIGGIDIDGVTADLKNGVLIVTLPKINSESSQKNIPIN